ncbi:ecdysteroid 22-kinase family protein [Stieleria sp. JC731]|uniref:ecdysteroid 22-kinase family protein n=1 Tax=Pirellulaceae TaxID=2691357 RepID=UPI001E5BD8C8|nr:ecdysteroid 22-kinase family protein [Stieleria sp. JC731]MCC9600946.1 ecdysteroid 22-kinase family protein [Stieleria sp. JC731]
MKLSTLPETVCRITGARSVELGEKIQSLWSGYGVIQRAELIGENSVPVVIKHIDLTKARSNRRGWGGDQSHQRKVWSYQVEKTFYETFSKDCDRFCKIPKFFGADETENEGGWVIVLEDLDALGFDCRRTRVTGEDIHACLRWLAEFHATFIGNPANGLWPVGTYWHLETRPDEFKAMPAGPLKKAAQLIDHKLNEARFQTLVHGDAKLANFCFSSRDEFQVAAVDFQYVGRGCGMKDVAYFISSCLSDEEAASQQDSLLSVYFGQLRSAISDRLIDVDVSALEKEWRSLYAIAWADFCRFLSGWCPDHWKLNAYTDRITDDALKMLGKN